MYYIKLGLAKLTQKIYIFINNLFLYSNLHTSYKILIDLMNIESSTQRHLRQLEKHKLYLQLTSKSLVIKLYDKKKYPNYYSTCLQYSELPLAYSVVFSSLQQIYNEFIQMNEAHFTFDQKTCEFKYTLKMSIKTLEMPFKLKAVVASKQEELEIQNYDLKEKQKELLKVIRETQSQLQESKLQSLQYKKKIAEIEQLLAKLQLQNVQQLQGLLTQLLKQAEKFFQTTKPQKFTQIDCEIIPQPDFQESKGSNKRSMKLWDPPVNKLYKKNVRTQQLKLLVNQKQKFCFFPSQEGKFKNKFSFGDNCRLKLIETNPNRFDFYSMFADRSINLFGRTVLSVVNIKEISHSKGVVVGFKSHSQSNIPISYNLKTGNLNMNIEGQETLVQMMHIKENQTLHLVINVQSRILKCYCNQIVVKQIILDESCFETSLVPFVLMSVAGEQIEFL